MIPVISQKNGEMLARNARNRVHKPPKPETLHQHLCEVFEQELAEVFEDHPDLEHGAATMTAAERTMEVVNERVMRIADNRKWAHIEEVNNAHYGG